MKRIILFALFLFCQTIVFGQTNHSVSLSQLPVLGISKEVSLHFISPEPISYVDISSHAIIGDLPEKNILRIKLTLDSLKSDNPEPYCTVTIVGQSYISQFNLKLLPAGNNGNLLTQIIISPENMRPLDVSGINISNVELKRHALDILLLRKKAPIRSFSNYGISASLNHVFTIGDYVFLDLGFKNETNLPFEFDELRFKIEDKKITKATNFQSIEILPEWQLYALTGFKKQYRNIYVIKKVSFPQNRLLNISISEKQLSGRNITLSLKYSDILNADSF